MTNVKFWISSIGCGLLIGLAGEYMENSNALIAVQKQIVEAPISNQNKYEDCSWMYQKARLAINRFDATRDHGYYGKINEFDWVRGHTEASEVVLSYSTLYLACIEHNKH